MDDVNIYIDPPPVFKPAQRRQIQAQLQPGQKLPELSVTIEPTKLTIGIKGNPPFLSEELGGTVKASESFWMIEDDELHIQMCKMRKAETWSCACKGHQTMDPVTQTEVQKNILMERFQEENPGFDFSQAQMNGNVPDPRQFMGGVGYK